MNDQLEKIVKMMADRQIRREQVAIKVGERFMLVQADEIIYASLADESINIVTGQVTGLSNYRTLDDLQARLDPEVFSRSRPHQLPAREPQLVRVHHDPHVRHDTTPEREGRGAHEHVPALATSAGSRRPRPRRSPGHPRTPCTATRPAARRYS